jgi:hypothetical protein
MLLLLADENFNNQIIRGIFRRNRTIDLLRVQDVGLSGADDPTILDWAARHNRVLLTNDAATMTQYAYERINANLPMPGVFEVSRRVSMSLAIEEILLLVECSFEGEWENQVCYLPL